MENYVITIARGYGSGGKTLGKLLAKELGINFYDREILRMASDASGINEALFGKADEYLSYSSLFHLAKKEYNGEVIPPDSEDFVSNENLFNYQAKVIRELAKTESFVVIGRCADYILKDFKNVIRLYFYAPQESCVKRIEALSGLSEKECIKKIKKMDKSRAEYYKFYTGKEWNDARNYDFCLNTASMEYEKLIEVVQEYLKVRKEEFN